METVCHNQLRFESLFSKEVIADFAGGRITSDAGGLLLRELDQRYRIAGVPQISPVSILATQAHCFTIELKSFSAFWGSYRRNSLTASRAALRLPDRAYTLARFDQASA